MTVLDAATGLAQGLGEHLRRWCQREGGSTAQQALLLQLGQDLALLRQAGHVCLVLERWLHKHPEHGPLEALRQTLQACAIVGSRHDPGMRPLVLDDQGRLYLQRDFDHERALAERLLALQRDAPTAVDAATEALLQTLFPPGPGSDGQLAAATRALRQRLSIVSGGPGTGKTTIVARLLACLLTQQPHARVALAAPTGKAAARLAEALRERAADLPTSIRDALPREAFTVHRLLGAGPQGFGYGATRPLPFDTLVVDEASMLDLALARQLFDAVPAQGRVVLLGDRDQLAAVESGAVFADLSRQDDARGLAACTTWLRHSHRFAGDSGIGRLAAAIQADDVETAMAQIEAERTPGLRRHDELTSELLISLWQPYVDTLRRSGASAAEVLHAFARQRVLCALREGPRGAGALNARLLAQVRAASGAPLHGDWFAGQPLLIERNDSLLKLFNGDVGVVWPGDDGALAAHFAAPDGRPRAVALARLPPQQPAFVMTVHKAQGSEFDRVLVVLPEAGSRVLSREWIYTAITRAKADVAVVGARAVVREALGRSTRRDGGLLDRISEARQRPAAAAGVSSL